MDPHRLRGRLNNDIQELGVARLDGWGILFDIYSKSNRCGVTDLVVASEYVLGVLYRLRRDLVIASPGERSPMDKIEGAGLDEYSNYERIEVRVQTQDSDVSAFTYAGADAGRRRYLQKSSFDQRVSRSYFQHLLSAVRKSFISLQEYVTYLVSKAGVLKEEVYVSSAVLRQLSDQACVESAQECCGLLAAPMA